MLQKLIRELQFPFLFFIFILFYSFFLVSAFGVRRTEAAAVARGDSFDICRMIENQNGSQWHTHPMGLINSAAGAAACVG